METNKKTKAIIYARVSSREQEETGYSLEAQEKLLIADAEKKGFEVIKIYKVAESASKWQIRKTLGEMLAFSDKNNASVILCEKIDRLTRSLKDAAIIDDWVRATKGREVHFVKENFVLSENTRAHENFVWDMKVAVARFYTNNLSEEVRKGQKEKVAQGGLPTKPPHGYKSVGEKGHKIHIVDTKTAPLIKKMFALYATGNYSTKALATKMYEDGLRSSTGARVVKSRVHVLLSDPFYYGKFRWKGVVYQGNHESLISRDLFDQVQQKLNGGKPHPYYTKRMTELRGKVLCGKCGMTTTWEKQKGHWYGGCKQCKAQLDEKKQYIRQEQLEDKLLEHLVSVAPKSERVLAVLKKALQESHGEEIAYHEAQVANINASLLRIQQRKEAMYSDRLDGRITTVFYDQRIQSSACEEEGLVEALGKLKSDNTEYYKVGIAIHDLALRAKAIYLSDKPTIEERRLLLAYAFSSVSVLKGVVTPTYTKPFGFLAEWMPKVNKEIGILEPKQNTAEPVVLSGDLPVPAPTFPLGLSDARLHSRTSKKPSVKARHGVAYPISRSLLRG